MDKIREQGETELVRHFSMIYARKGSARARDFYHNVDGEILDGVLRQLRENRKEYRAFRNDHYEPTVFFEKEGIVIKVVTIARDSPEVLDIESHAVRKESLGEIARKFNLPLEENKIHESFGDYRSVRGVYGKD